MKLDNKTQLFRPLKTPLDNKASFYRYNLRQHFNVGNAISTVVLICSLIGSVTDFLNFFGDTGFNQAFYLFGIAASLIAKLIGYAKHYDERFTTVSFVPGAYDAVEPPDLGWVRRDLHLSATELEPVFTCDAVDDWLLGQQPIGLERDQDYEKSLRKVIRDDARWQGVYRPFLQHNHLEAMYHGKQFYNEQKFGISSELIPGAPSVQVHKTCYFDSYLTNIIPGRELTSNRDDTVAAQTYPDLMPYQTDIKGVRRLMLLGEIRTANEPGVTTLCILPSGSICLWRQNRMAQCSTGRVVASGSGSADWEDCKSYFHDENGFRKAVIKGMQRELWEESNGSRELKIDRFMKNVDTRITGYFRWLKKGGKSELVGVSRLRDTTLTKYLTPEKSEVVQGGMLPAKTMRELIDSLSAQTQTQDGKDYMVNNCSVSCAMAMISLERTCRKYCAQTCPHYDREKGCCGAQNCQVKPFDALFENVTVVRP